MSPIIRLIAPILGSQAKRIFFNHSGLLGYENVRSKSEGKSTVAKDEKNPWLSITNEEWRQKLTNEEYEVTRNKGTEMPFTGKYYNNNKEGFYLCTCCSQTLFSSKEKYDSGSGWPSFFSPFTEKGGEVSGPVKLKTDTSYGLIRTEVLCDKCDAHLGHLFNDGPPPTGLRYCINSVSLKFLPTVGTDDDKSKPV